ncbi:NAD-dependent epimerase/dehydratase family protein, partial [Candidatus Woesearchaeota archaeon]|nr:NAD-dependent epimerase/dehydratase family protein [Candidatus Woesearchaeota archaeon]
MVGKKKALITGITGQDGSYLAEFLLEKNYEVYGLVRSFQSQNMWRIENVKDKISLKECDLTNQKKLELLIKDIQPDEIYNLAAQSFVGISW